MNKTCLFCDQPVTRGNGWQGLTCAKCERIHMDRIKMSTDWCEANPWPVDPVEFFGPEKFAEVVEENKQIACARREAGPQFCASNPWPAVPGQELDQPVLQIQKVPAERLPAIPNHSWQFRPVDLFISCQSIKTISI